MVIRIVKMSFQPDKVEEFMEVFNASKEKIRHFEGCQHLELLRDMNQPNVLSTYSFWDHPDSLEKYRHSELFKTTWEKTKILFNDKPQAWSFERVAEL